MRSPSSRGSVAKNWGAHEREEADADSEPDRPPTSVRTGYLISIRQPILTSIQDMPVFVRTPQGIDIGVDDPRELFGGAGEPLLR